MWYSILHRLSKQLLLAFILVLPFSANAAITDGKFGINQIFDVQYYWSGNTLNASNFIAPYNKNFQPVTVTAGQYFEFFPSTTNPGKYGLKLMNSNGTQHSIVHDHGDITALGNGAIFYIGSGFFGNVITTAAGYNYGASATFTNMDTSVTSTDLNNYTFASTTPLAAGQTAAPPAPAYGTNFTRVTSYEWKTYTDGSQQINHSSEKAPEAFDNDNNSKWLGLRSVGAWAIVQFVTDGTYSPTRAIQKIQFVTANDASGRDPTGFRVWGSINGIDWVLISEQAISLPTGRHTASTVYSLNNVTAFSYYKIEFTGVRNGGDTFQVAEIRLLYDVDDPQGTQAGGGIYVQPTPVYGPSGASTIQQTLRTNALNENPYGHNAVVGIVGDDNIVTIQQIGSSGHYASVDIQGNVNTVSVEQTGANGSRHYLNTTIIGSNNNLILKQSDANKTQFVLVNGNDNTIATNQKGIGSHFLNLDVAGDNHTVGIVQEGAGNHSANVMLSGSQPWNFQLNQNSSTSQHYTLPHGMSDGSAVSGTCAAIGGCNLTVNQQ